MDPGRVIRARRIANGLTQAQLATRAGSTQAAISRLERGEVSPTFETFERLLFAIGEEAHLEVRRIQSDHDPERLKSLRALTPAQRLRLAITRNRLAGEFSAAGANRRRKPA